MEITFGTAGSASSSVASTRRPSCNRFTASVASTYSRARCSRDRASTQTQVKSALRDPVCQCALAHRVFRVHTDLDRLDPEF